MYRHFNFEVLVYIGLQKNKDKILYNFQKIIEIVNKETSKR